MTTPQRFRKRPVEIEAMQWDGTAADLEHGRKAIVLWRPEDGDQ